MVNGVYKPTNITGGHHLVVNISKPMLNWGKSKPTYNIGGPTL